MRTIAIGLVLVLGSALVTINVLPFLLLKWPVLRDDARLGAGAMAGVFVAAVSIGAVAWRWLRRR